MIDDNGMAMIGHKHHGYVAVQRNERDKSGCGNCVLHDTIMCSAIDSIEHFPVGCGTHNFVWIEVENY